MSAATAGSAPLDDIMLAMDVADTLRHNQNLGGDTAVPDGAPREQQLIERLRELYHRQGIEVSDSVLREGVAALGESRFSYQPPKPAPAVWLARAYVARKRWLPPAFSIFLMLAISLGGYFLVYRPYHDAQIEAARLELAETLPAQMDALYQTIYEETKVQAAANEADAARVAGKSAAAAGDRGGAETAVERLLEIRDTLRQEYQLRIASRQGEKPGFWRFPKDNTDATNYYIIVAAVDAQGKAIPFPVRNEEDEYIRTASRWGLRVPEAVYRAVEADFDDDGALQHGLVGTKQFGYLDVDFVVQVLGGTVTRW